MNCYCASRAPQLANGAVSFIRTAAAQRTLNMNLFAVAITQARLSKDSSQLLLWKRHVAANLVVLPFLPILEIPLALFYSNVGYKNYLRG